MEITELPPLPIAITKEAIQDLEGCKDSEVFTILEKHFRKITRSTRSVKLKGFQPYSKRVFTIRRIKAGSWRIIYTKYNGGEYLVLKVAPRKDVYKDIIKSGLFEKIYDILPQDQINLNDYLNKFHKFLPVLNEKQEIKVELNPNLGKGQSFEINLLGQGNNFVISGGAGTGKSISASDMVVNFLDECRENNLPSRVVFITPENLVQYFSKSPILYGPIRKKQIILSTFRGWLQGFLEVIVPWEVPEWLELGVLNLTGRKDFTPQDLVLYQLYVIAEREILEKELTSIDHKNRITILEKILPSQYLENLTKYLAFYSVIRKFTGEIKTISISNWNTLNRLYLRYIKKSPDDGDTSLNHIHYVLNQPGKDVVKEFRNQLEALKEFISDHGEHPSRIGYLNLAKKKLSLSKSHPSKERILLVVDEAQDLLKDEMVFLCDHANELRSQGDNVHVRFFGDLCQRLYPTGFMWEQVGNLRGNIKKLDINYRNSNRILDITNQLLRLQSEYISRNDARNFSNISYQGTFDGNNPRLLVLENFKKAVEVLARINGLVFHQGRVNSLRKELSNSMPVLALPQSSAKGFMYEDYSNLLMLDIRNAKGMEFYGNVIFCPFLDKEINSQNFMEWYTIFSRTEERLLLIITNEEKERLSKTGFSFNVFDEAGNLEDCVSWINEKNTVSISGLDISLINKVTGDALLNGHFYEDTYEILEEAGNKADEWENHIFGLLTEIPMNAIEYLGANVSSLSFQCLLERHAGRHWDCCELATEIVDAKERVRIIGNMINDLHTKHMMPLEAERIRHFYLNESKIPFNEDFKGFKLQCPGKKFQPLDAYLPEMLMAQIASEITERMAAHD